MHPLLLVKPNRPPVLDPDFRPAVLGNRIFRSAVRSAVERTPLEIALERGGGAIAAQRIEILGPGSPSEEANLSYVERLVKTLLWHAGGFRVVVGGPVEVGRHIERHYAPDGPRAFDVALMADVHDRPFRVEVTTPERVPAAREPEERPRGGHLEGCRLGFDAGASDHKVAAVVDGEVVFSRETPWLPSVESDPSYHYRAIAGAMREAAKRMPRVDAIGVSAAGVYVENRVKVASLFRAVPRDAFRRNVETLFLDIQKELGGPPMEVVNDGEVAALAGSMSLGEPAVLGIALGSSEAGGYVTPAGAITTWLNELAFSTLDYRPDAPSDEWSGDRGCGGEYLSQKAAIRLAAAAGIELEGDLTPARKLAAIQERLSHGDERARRVFETIGGYLGYGIAHYAELYDIRHVMLMGRVVSGAGGNIVLEEAREVLRSEFPEVAGAVTIHLPDEANRRVGQAVAAASLPFLR